MHTQPTTKQAASIFLKAAAYIRQYGWQKEGMGEHGAPRCSMGAIESAGPPRAEWSSDLADLMYRILNRELDGMSLTSFNSQYQSGEKVAQLYERAAAALARSQRGQTA